MEIDAEGNRLRRQARVLPAGPNDLVGGGRAFLRGIPMAGEYLDEGFAAFDATFGGDRSEGWGDRWNSAVEEQRAYDADFDRRNPMASVLLRTAGGAIMPGGPMVGAGAKLLGAAARLPKAGAGLQWIGGRLMPTRAQLGSKVAAEAGKGFAGMAHDGGKVRDAAKTARRVEGLLGRFEANGPVAGVLPLPSQAY